MFSFFLWISVVGIHETITRCIQVQHALGEEQRQHWSSGSNLHTEIPTIPTIPTELQQQQPQQQPKTPKTSDITQNPQKKV